jgi:hypothetical protein
MTVHRFWSFDGDCRDTHATAEEARKACERALDDYRDDAGDGWDEAVTSIMWGEIRELVVETKRVDEEQARAENDGELPPNWPDGCDAVVDYALRPTTPAPTYVAIAYRWGDSNGHWYIAAAGPERSAVEAAAEKECDDRGGKYGIAVYEEPSSERLAYFPSSFGEPSPTFNHRIGLIAALGHDALSAAEEGKAWLPAPNRNGRLRTLTCQDVDVPQWLRDRLDHHRRVERAWADAKERHGTPLRDDPPREAALEAAILRLLALTDDSPEAERRSALNAAREAVALPTRSTS